MRTQPPPNASWRDLYPFASSFHDCRGLKYHYVDTAPKDADREVILCVHGNPTWSFYWRNLIAAFQDSYRVVAVDHIGCGLSDKPSAHDYDYTLAQRIDDLVSLIDSLKLRRVTLVGHDWGGAIGLGAVCARRDVFDRIVLMNTGAFTGERCPVRIRLGRVPFFGRLAICGLNSFARAATTMAVTKPLPNAVAAGLLAPYNSWANRVATYEFVRDIPLDSRHRSFATLRGIESQLTSLADKRICLIWGVRDWCFTPKFLARFQQFFPNAETHTISDASHYVVEDATDEVIATIREFLKKKS
ncbi:MAG: alpha/beta fold hydrolase [Thermoguttaceae bacterium]